MNVCGVLYACVVYVYTAHADIVPVYMYAKIRTRYQMSSSITCDVEAHHF